MNARTILAFAVAAAMAATIGASAQTAQTPTPTTPYEFRLPMAGLRPSVGTGTPPGGPASGTSSGTGGGDGTQPDNPGSSSSAGAPPAVCPSGSQSMWNDDVVIVPAGCSEVDFSVSGWTNGTTGERGTLVVGYAPVPPGAEIIMQYPEETFESSSAVLYIYSLADTPSVRAAGGGQDLQSFATNGAIATSIEPGAGTNGVVDISFK